VIPYHNTLRQRFVRAHGKSPAQLGLADEVAVISGEGTLLGSAPPATRRLVSTGAAVGTSEKLVLQIKATRRFSATEPCVLQIRPSSAVAAPVDAGGR